MESSGPNEGALYELALVLVVFLRSLKDAKLAGEKCVTCTLESIIQKYKSSKTIAEEDWKEIYNFRSGGELDKKDILKFIDYILEITLSESFQINVAETDLCVNIDSTCLYEREREYKTCKISLPLEPTVKKMIDAYFKDHDIHCRKCGGQAVYGVEFRANLPEFLAIHPQPNEDDAAKFELSAEFMMEYYSKEFKYILVGVIMNLNRRLEMYKKIGNIWFKRDEQCPFSTYVTGSEVVLALYKKKQAIGNIVMEPEPEDGTSPTDRKKKKPLEDDTGKRKNEPKVNPLSPTSPVADSISRAQEDWRVDPVLGDFVLPSVPINNTDPVPSPHISRHPSPRLSPPPSSHLFEDETGHGEKEPNVNLNPPSPTSPNPSRNPSPHPSRNPSPHSSRNPSSSHTPLSFLSQPKRSRKAPNKYSPPCFRRYETHRRKKRRVTGQGVNGPDEQHDEEYYDTNFGADSDQTSSEEARNSANVETCQCLGDELIRNLLSEAAAEYRNLDLLPDNPGMFEQLRRLVRTFLHYIIVQAAVRTAEGNLDLQGCISAHDYEYIFPIFACVAHFFH